MTILAERKAEAFADSVRFEREMLVVGLVDGREVAAPLEWFPRLRNASETQRGNWRLIGRGIGVHWPDIDEDISIEGLLSGRASAFRP